MARIRKPMGKLLMEFDEGIARFVIYGLGGLLLASLVLSLTFAWVAFISMREAEAYREAARGAQDNARSCQRMLVRTEGKLEMVETLFATARGLRNNLEEDSHAVGGD